ncbi:DUF4367 domain-containing protein [Methanogenium marinum]|uniref:DUF4367 domain-containing protein n=1 Tax=Methanogenium marinum TaxID=348610 RepID=A0A9Q4PXN1_9EURY|nr:DUF4367 domain-containing protein [Methanogenium marinum]MDE4908816.1 DUF4367 domain-containing protein [Methanogenium marinum]
MRGIKRWRVWCYIACLTLVLAAGCLDNEADTPAVNETEKAIEIALANPEVQESIPVDTGAYEILDAGPAHYEATGPEGSISWTGTEMKFRVINQSSVYYVFVDVPNGTVVRNYWQYIKDPLPCMQTGPPEEYASLEEAAEASGPDCRLAAPYYVPEGYGFSKVQVFGDPCPRRQIYYTSQDDTLRLVQTCAGDPPWAFAISALKYSTVMVNGAEAKVVDGISETQISWTTTGNTSYWLWGNFDTDELHKVAQSVAPFTGPATPTPTKTHVPGELITPGKSHFGAPVILWPDSITVKAGTTNTGEIVAESREKGYGMVHLSIVSHVSGEYNSTEILPPDGMELSITPADFMTYPKETYYPEITVSTTAATPPGEYVFLVHETWQGYGGGHFDVVVTE